MRKVVTILLLCVMGVTNVYAAKWTKLQENKHASLMLDKQSITTSGKYQKAWVKINYKTLQTNMQYPEKVYNHAKLLWYFDCAEQQSATAQVYQLHNEDLVFSAAIDIKRARFLEPVPETEADSAMHYVCRQKAHQEAVVARKAKAVEAEKNKPPTPEKSTAPVVKETEPAAAEPEKKAASNQQQDDVKAKPDDSGAKKVDEAKSDEAKSDKTKISKKEKHDQQNDQHGKDDVKADSNQKDGAEDEEHEAEKKPVKRKKRAASWKYEGKRGPEFWGDLSEDYATCKTGSNQSPIDINKTMVTTLKPLKTFLRFPVTEVINNGHTIQAEFKSGNILVVDAVMYQMKHVNFHAPSENQIMGKSFPLEAHFVHADPKGKLAVLAVMFDEGHENKGIAKLWKQMPKRKGKPAKITAKVLASELMPRKKDYYRFSGSITTPPCSEGVIWVVMKTPMTASKQQIAAFKKVMRNDNNRPTQPLNGRIIVE